MNRKQAREFVMQTIFQIDAQKDFDTPDVDRYMKECPAGSQKEYIRNLISSICGHISYIDAVIDEASKGWPAARMAKPDLAIIRVAIGEMIFADDVPDAVAINEAINLAKIYGTDHSPQFVNGVLGKAELENKPGTK